MEINLKYIGFFKKRFYFCKTILEAKARKIISLPGEPQGSILGGRS